MTSPTDNKIQQLHQLTEMFTSIQTKTLSEVPEDVAVLIGPTESGKSTLLNSLLGNNLIAVKDPKLRSISIKKADDESGPEIDHNSILEMPTRWVCTKKLSGLVIWDTPGSGDSGNVLMDLVNAFYIDKLFHSINSAKIVLVVDFNYIFNDRVNSFISLLNSLEIVFKGKLKDCFSNIIVVFSKVPKIIDDEPVTTDFINEILVNKILSSTSIKMSELTKKFIEYLTKNHNQIGIFRKASVGSISSDIDENIIQALHSIRGIQTDILKTTSPNISETAKVFLTEIQQQMSNDAYTEVENTFKITFEDALNDFRSSVKMSDNEKDKLSLLKNEVMDLENKIKMLIDEDVVFFQKIENIISISPTFKEKINIENLIKISKSMEFLDRYLDLEKNNVLPDALQLILKKFRLNLNEIYIDLQLSLNEIDEKKAEEDRNKKFADMEDDLQRLKEKYECLEKNNFIMSLLRKIPIIKNGIEFVENFKPSKNM